VGSVLATGPKGRGFKPGRRDGFLRAIKIRSTPSFAWEVKPEVLCRKILRHVKDPLKYLRYWIGKILTPSYIPPICPRCLCWYNCQRALVGESGVMPSRHNHHNGSQCSHITRRMNSRPGGGRSSETCSHPIIINQSAGRLQCLFRILAFYPTDPRFDCLYCLRFFVALVSSSVNCRKT
jgi:hypothetical protein